MRLEARDGLLGCVIGVLIITSALTGCSGGSSDVAGASAPMNSGSPAASTSSLGNSLTARIALSSSAYTAAPSASAVVVINRSGSSKGAATVSYTTVNGTATAGVDYARTSGSVSWGDGEVGSKTVNVPLMSSAKGKNFGFALTSVTGQADFGAPAVATVGVSTSATGSSSSSSGSSTSSSSSGTASTTSSVTLSWAAPTQNTDGSPLTNLAGFDIYYGKSASAMTNKIAITNSGLLTYVVGNLGAGTWYFEVLAVNSSGAESNPSGVVSTVI